jgi:2-polyprenyl-6-methoxyphenol hydroxylase-like FAD-dependent oxidoreductase
MQAVGESALVIGAGIAGLCAARTLAGRFERVLVLDRDKLPDSAVPRRGVTQGGHGHVLLVAGQRALGELFPGLMDELVEAGAVPFDPGMELSFYRFGSIWPREASELRLVTFSLPLLELAIRRRVAALPGVSIRDGVSVTALVGHDDGVIGARLDDGELIASDLILDCTGRGARSNHWLTALGFPAPRVGEVKVGVGYATRFYRRSPGDLVEGSAVFSLPSPPAEKRAGVALPVEGDRWLISLGGWHGDFPRDLPGYEQHARELPHPGIARLLGRCEPLTELSVVQYPASRRRYFEELSELPGGYLALGDSICSFNPIYGQGMTCAALEAIELGRLLDSLGGSGSAGSGSAGSAATRSASAGSARSAATGSAALNPQLSTRYYQQAARIVATPWQFATGADFNYPETTGERPRGIRLKNAYAKQIQLASMVDPDVRRVFTAVQHLIADPAELLKPTMVARVLQGARKAPAQR